MLLDKFENDTNVRKNDLINAKIKLNAKAYDLVRSFISMINRDDIDFKIYTISNKDLNIDYKEVKNIIRHIMKNPVEIENHLTKEFEIFSWFVYMKYKKGSIEARFNSDLKDMMLQIKNNYTKTYEKYILPLRSIYSKRLYELLFEYKDIGYRKFDIKELQNKLCVPVSIKRYSAFKERVLLTAVKEINEHTDLYLNLPLNNKDSNEWVKLQCGKKRGITHLNFNISINLNNINIDKIILKWVDEIRKTHINKKLIPYNKGVLDGYISVSSKGMMYLQNKKGNAILTAKIDHKQSWEVWKYMYYNKNETLIDYSLLKHF